MVESDKYLNGEVKMFRRSDEMPWILIDSIKFHMEDNNTKRLDFKAAVGPHGEHAFVTVTSINPEFIGGDDHFTARFSKGEWREESYIPTALAPDGRHAAGGEYDQAWVQPDDFRIHAPLTKHITFGPEGKRLVTVHADGHARLWFVDKPSS